MKSDEIVAEYINSLSKEYQTGASTEHSYRGHLKKLLESLDEEIIAINEPKRVKIGAPDYLIATKSDYIEIGYIEAKDIGKDINHKSYTEQFSRYKDAFENLVITDYMEFQFYQYNNLYTTIKIAEISNNKINIIQENIEKFVVLIKSFSTFVGQTITSSSKLAKMMAGKAKMMSDLICNALMIDNEEEAQTELSSQYVIFREMLIHDMSEKDFADMYAQTITYGMFTARLHDTTLNTFSRQEAAELLPKSNPFLRKLFQHIAGYDLDDRLAWSVDSLVKIFIASDVKVLLEDFGASTQRNDPIIHFYEEFLAEFDPKLRKSRGVWYTPEPVVKFIVRAVDEVLVDEFHLPKGLADSSKIIHKIDDLDRGFTKGKVRRKREIETHKVQILDPATGTGTFLAETIKFIHEKKQYFQWSNYVERDLIPRIHGFEILMASYSMAHLKLDMLLKMTGYAPETAPRFNVFLTNSLEKHHDETGTLFSSFLSTESQEADRVKKDTPVMVVVGNPPYAVSSSNDTKDENGKLTWIGEKIADYKKDLNERKINLDDDYIKFIRYGQHYIEKKGEGILAYISNNSFIDGITHRQMRKSLLESFDKIYILDLHGNSKKKELCPDGSKDDNVFDIMQGVSINIFIKKKSNSKKLADVYHCDLYGRREGKYNFLNENSLKSIEWAKLEYTEPNYFFVYKDFKAIKEYEKGFKIDELMNISTPGIETIRDKLTIHFTKENLEKVVNDFSNLEEEEISSKYNTKDSRDWKISRAKEDISNNINDSTVRRLVNYRPFDIRNTFYTGKQNGFVCNGRFKVMKHLLKENIGLAIKRGLDEDRSMVGFLTKYISDRRFWSSPGMQGAESIFPLYLYPDKDSLEDQKRTPNLNLEIVGEIEEKLNLKFTPEKEEDKSTFAPIDILDYIYAVLHSPNYRETYKEFLKIDFPRVPYPTISNFWELVALGGELRSYHLLENPKIYEIVIAPNDSQNNTIERRIVKKDIEIDGDLVKLWLNDEQYIDNIPLVAWEFYIGGYQPAQKWLKDRRGREMREEDYEHYNKIIVSLTETDRVMREVDVCMKS